MALRRGQATPEDNQARNRSMTATKAALQPQTDGVRSSVPTDRAATTEEIRMRIENLAYEFYERRGFQDGHDREDWLEAERQALAQSAGPGKNGHDRFSPLPPA